MIDTYGSGTGTWIDNKEDAHEEYMFQVVIENGKYPEYVSEKFYDCIKTKTVPIYYGGKHGTQKMGFDPEGIIYFDSIDELKTILTEKLSEGLYSTMLPAVERNHDRLSEIRAENKLKMFYNSHMTNYLYTPEGYLDDTNELNLSFENM
jgi:hypothetical protein